VIFRRLHQVKQRKEPVAAAVRRVLMIITLAWRMALQERGPEMIRLYMDMARQRLEAAYTEDTPLEIDVEVRILIFYSTTIRYLQLLCNIRI